MSCRLFVIADDDNFMHGVDVTDLKPHHLQTIINNVDEDDREMLADLVDGQFTSPGAAFAAMATHLGPTKVGALVEKLT